MKRRIKRTNRKKNSRKSYKKRSRGSYKKRSRRSYKKRSRRSYRKRTRKSYKKRTRKSYKKRRQRGGKFIRKLNENENPGHEETYEDDVAQQNLEFLKERQDNQVEYGEWHGDGWYSKIRDEVVSSKSDARFALAARRRAELTGEDELQSILRQREPIGDEAEGEKELALMTVGMPQRLESYEEMTPAQLRRHCEDARLSAEGTKADMINRLMEYERRSGAEVVGEGVEFAVQGSRITVAETPEERVNSVRFHVPWRYSGGVVKRREGRDAKDHSPEWNEAMMAEVKEAEDLWTKNLDEGEDPDGTGKRLVYQEEVEIDTDVANEARHKMAVAELHETITGKKAELQDARVATSKALRGETDDQPDQAKIQLLRKEIELLSDEMKRIEGIIKRVENHKKEALSVGLKPDALRKEIDDRIASINSEIDPWLKKFAEKTVTEEDIVKIERILDTYETIKHDIVTKLRVEYRNEKERISNEIKDREQAAKAAKAEAEAKAKAEEEAKAREGAAAAAAAEKKMAEKEEHQRIAKGKAVMKMEEGQNFMKDKRYENATSSFNSGLEEEFSDKDLRSKLKNEIRLVQVLENAGEKLQSGKDKFLADDFASAKTIFREGNIGALEGFDIAHPAKPLAEQLATELKDEIRKVTDAEDDARTITRLEQKYSGKILNYKDMSPSKKAEELAKAEASANKPEFNLDFFDD